MVDAMSEILTPFLAAFILAYILEPVTLSLEALKIPRSLAALFTLILGVFICLTIVLLLLNLLQHEIPLIKKQFPSWLASIQLWATPKLTNLNIELDWSHIREQLTIQISSQVADNANSLVTKTLSTVLASSGSFFLFIANLVLILFILFYLLLDWKGFFKLLGQLIPQKLRPILIPIVQEVDELLSQYLRGQFLVMLILAIYYSTGLYLIGVQSAIALGAFTGLVAFIPYVGFLISFSLSTLGALLQFGPSNALLLVLALYGAGQLLEGFFLTPRLVGERIGLHPVAVLFALMVFGQLFGFFGILLALPMAAISLVAIRYSKARYLDSAWFKEK